MTRLVHITTISASMRAFVDQAEHMLRQGFEVHTIASPGAYADFLERDKGITVHRLSIERMISPRRDLRSVYKLAEILRRIRPEIVHAHTPKAGLLGMLAARWHRVPVRIYHIRGLRYETAASSRRQLLMSAERLACHCATQVLAVGNSMREMAIRDRIVGADKIQVLLEGSHGLDSTMLFHRAALPAGTREQTRDRLGIPQTACVIGFVGRLVADKGVIDLHAAWQLIRAAFPSTHLLMVGPWEPEYPLPANVVDSLQSDPRVHLTGADFDTPPLFAAMDIACLPSYREGLPKMPLEAAAMELPVVATQIPGCVDAVVHQHTGWLVPVGDAEALAAALARYVDDEPLRLRHGQNGRRRIVEHFQPADMHRAMYELYGQLLRRAGLDVPSSPVDSSEPSQMNTKAA